VEPGITVTHGKGNGLPLARKENHAYSMADCSVLNEQFGNFKYREDANEIGI
jgi:hypothetical protein